MAQQEGPETPFILQMRALGPSARKVTLTLAALVFDPSKGGVGIQFRRCEHLRNMRPIRREFPVDITLPVGERVCNCR